MANLTRINNNQITDAQSGNTQFGVNAAVKLQNYTVTSTKLANNLTYGSDLVITGNLTVNGNTTTIDTTIVTVEDPMISLAYNQTGTPTLDIGTIGIRGSANNVALIWQESSKQFLTGFTNDDIGNTTLNIIGYADFLTANANVTGNLTVGGNIDITGNVTSLTVVGNIAGGNLLTTGLVSATGNVTGGNVTTAGQLGGGTASITGNVTAGNISTSGLISATGAITGGSISTAGDVSGANILTTGIVSAVGNIIANTGAFFIGNGSQLTGVAAESVNANALVGNTLSANVLFSSLTTVGTLTSLSVSGNATSGNLLTGGILSATGDVTGGNVTTAGVVSATGNIYGSNIFSLDRISATGGITSNSTITGANILTDGAVSATGNVRGGNINTVGLITATGNITGGNLDTGGTVNATGNIVGGNVTTAGLVSATGNVYGGNVIAENGFFGNLDLTGNVVVNSLTSNTYVSATGNVISGNVLTDGYISATGNVISGNVNTTLVSASGNVIGSNLLTSGEVSATGNVTSGNVNTTLVSASGNVIGGNVTTAGIVTATGNVIGANLTTAGIVTATGNIQGGNLFTNGYISATGNVISGNVNTTIVSATGNVVASNLLTDGIVSATGNVTGGNVTTAGLISATGNIQGGNLLTSGLISAAGLATSGNVETAGYVSATGNVYGGNVVTTLVTSAAGDLSISAAADLVLEPTGNIVLDGGKYINQLLDPVQAQDAATKQYVDDAVSSGITIHTPVRAEANVALNGTYAQGGTTATVTDTIAGNTVVFSTAVNPQPNDQYWFSNSFNGILANTAYFVVSAPNTSAAVLSLTYSGAPVTNITSGTGLTQGVRINSGIGATLTNAGANVALVIDGVSVVATNRVLIYSEANAAHNGVYTVTNAGNATSAWQLTRSTDTDVYGPKSTDELDVGDYFYVQEGNSGAGESYVMTAPTGPFIIGYDNLTFTQFSASQVYTANTNAGLSLTGTVFSAKVDNNTTAFDGGGNIIVKAGANLTTPNIGDATGTTLNVTGNVQGGNLLANAAVIATGNIAGANITTVGLISATGNVTGNYFIGNGSQLTGVAAASVDANNLTGNTLSANVLFSSLTTVGTLTSLSVSGTTTSGNLETGGTVSATGNVTGGNVTTSGLITATGNIEGGNVTTSGLVSASGNVIGSNLLTTGEVSATGNVNSGNVNTTLVSASGNVIGSNLLTTGEVSATGNVNSGNVNTTLVSASGNITGGNVLTGGQISASGNISGNSLYGTGVVSTTGNITGGNIDTAGQISATGNITGGNISTAGIISATGEITSLTTITGGNLYTGGFVSAAGDIIGNGVVSVTGDITGANLYFGSGVVSGTGNIYATNIFANISGNIDAAGSNTQVQFNDTGDILGASAGFTFDKTANLLTVDGNIVGGNFNTTGLVTATGNVTGGNVLTGGLISATGNVTGGNFVTAGLVTATGNIAGGNVTTAGEVSATGNVTSGNVNTTIVSATGNVVAGNVTTAGLITATGNISTGAALQGGNIVISGDDITDTNGRVNINTAVADVDFAVNGLAANVFYVDAGANTASFGNSTQYTNVLVAFNTTSSIRLPVGTGAQQPAVGITGMIRFNTSLNVVEVFDNAEWVAVGAPQFTVIADQQFNGDGSTVAFTLSSTQTTNSCIVSINGVVQIPTVAYSVNGIDPTCVLTFTEAPQAGDLIDVRELTTTTTVASISNSSGNAVVDTSPTANSVLITGALIPVANNTQTLGSATNYWKTLYVGGNTIYLGNLQLKEASANTFAVYTADGITQANIDVGSIDVTSIQQGNTTIGIASPNGNAYIQVGGTSNTAVWATTGQYITGVVSASGNITGNYIFGNGSQLTGIDATSIQSGTSNVRVVSSGGNVATGVGGTGNVVVVSTTGQYVTGVISASGNITATNWLTSANISATGNAFVDGYMSVTGNLYVANVVSQGNLTVTDPLVYFINTSSYPYNYDIGFYSAFVGGTGNTYQHSGLVRDFADNTWKLFSNVPEPDGSAVDFANAIYDQFQSGNILSTGLLSTAGNITAGTSIYATGNSYGGNLLTAGFVSAGGNIIGTNHLGTTVSVTGNVTGGNVLTGGVVSSTGNITGGNISATNHTGTSVSVTGNVTAGNVSVSTGTITVGNIVNGNGNGIGNIGSSTTYFNTVFAKATSAQYADLAEKYVADAEYAPGTVVVFGGTHEVTVNAVDGDRKVAGVVSTNPSYIMNGTLEAEHVATVALTGRVPTMVIGPVRKGDMMVAAGLGRARAEADPKVGTVIGKALEDFDGVEGTIEVVVGRF